jgi:hypothetical protein
MCFCEAEPADQKKKNSKWKQRQESPKPFAPSPVIFLTAATGQKSFTTQENI